MRMANIVKKIRNRISRFFSNPARSYDETIIRLYMRLLVRKLYKMRSYFYEPVRMNGKIFESKRRWEQRWEAIKKEIVKYEASNILDIGSSEGFFLRLASEELGCFSLGIDTQNKRILPGEIARLYDKVTFCANMEGFITPVSIKKLPCFDVVLCLSVVHHIIRHEGYDKGTEFVKAIATRTKKALIFEMGTSEETVMDWSSDMPAMPAGQLVFLREFLTRSGFKNIREIGQTSSIEQDAKRILVVAEPDI